LQHYTGGTLQDYFIWLVAGFALVIAELLSGTFYLLVLGVAAFAAAGVAYLQAGFAVQAVVAAIVTGAGLAWVQRWRRRTVADKMPPLDAGQPAVFESWIDRSSRQARVKYRDTLWDAVIDEPADSAPGEVLYIVSMEGNTLKVSRKRP
jgi:membrane protein implicated in regulation of membrane protease activity